MERKNAVRGAAALLLAVLGAAGPVQAQDGMLSRLYLHGYITQGLGSSTDNELHGIPVKKLTADYRSVALQVRYAATEEDAVVVQIGNRTLGLSPLSEHQDLKLKWAYYQKHFRGTDIRIGRTPYVKGIYNETRDVGTLIPFFRAPYNTYTDGLESLDGVVVAHRFGLPAGFSTDLSAFGGGSDFVELSPNVQQHTVYVVSSRFSPMLGGQLWLNLPVRGVRLGFHGERFGVDNYHLSGTSADHTGTTVMGSLDASLDRVFLRTETLLWKPGQYDYHSAYAQAGIQPLPRLWLNGQWEAVKVTLHPGMAVPIPEDVAGEFARDLAAGLKYDLSPMVSLKVEGHQARGHQFDTPTDLVMLTANGLTFGPGLKTNYWLASISAAF